MTKELLHIFVCILKLSRMCLEIYDVSREIGFMQADPLFKFVRGMDSILVLVDE